MSIIRDAIFKGVRKITDKFNRANFPHPDDAWTAEQQAIFNWLNGESGGFSRVADSDREEMRKTLSRLAGIDMQSRFDVNQIADIPPYAIVVFRTSTEGYTGGYPHIRSRLSGFWAENGSGSSTPVITRVRNLRPVTEDEIRRVEQGFPPGKLNKLYGAIEFPNEGRLREEIAKAIILRTQEFANGIRVEFPEGLTDKGRQILEMSDWDMTFKRAFSLILDDPAMLQPFERPSAKVIFTKYCAIWCLTNENSHAYALNMVHVQADANPADIFFWNPEEPPQSDEIGNHMDTKRVTFRVATDEEITAYVQSLKFEKLHLYVPAMTDEQIIGLLEGDEHDTAGHDSDPTG